MSRIMRSFYKHSKSSLVFLSLRQLSTTIKQIWKVLMLEFHEVFISNASR